MSETTLWKRRSMDTHAGLAAFRSYSYAIKCAYMNVPVD